jgi:DNA-binding NarL/FixJ family response regulator
VVVADDVEDLRWLVRAVLNADDRFDVVGEARDGREAVDVVQRTRADVVILDLRMPEMDGLEAAAAISEASPETKVVVFSALDESAVGASAQVVGVTAYLEKGASPRVILDTVARAVSDTA